MGRRVKQRLTMRELKRKRKEEEREQRIEQKEQEVRLEKQETHRLPPGIYAINDMTRGKLGWGEDRKPFVGEVPGMSEYEKQQAEQRRQDLRKPITMSDDIPTVVEKCRFQDFIRHEHDAPDPYEFHLEHLLPSRRRRGRE